jgi:hypothetical protein
MAQLTLSAVFGFSSQSFAFRMRVAIWSKRRSTRESSKSGEAGLPACSFLADIPSMEQEIDCKMQSNSR